ncbi:hypothetical protein PG989_013645 [Apiospora arundinis]
MQFSMAALLAYASSSATAGKYCDAATGVCYSEVSASNATYRVAIPNVNAAPFDILLQIVAPKSVGWAGIAWGGHMAENPLTLGWANGKESTVVSSRWATGHTMPGPYQGATYEVLKGSGSNDTHWTLTTLCHGCSQWKTDNGTVVQGLDPAVTAPINVAFALSAKAPTQPANNASAIGFHSAKGPLKLDLAAAKTDLFDEYVQALM